MSRQWNRQLNRYVWKVVECLQQNKSIAKDHQIPAIRGFGGCRHGASNTKKMNRLQNIRIEIWKYKTVKKYKT